MRDYFTQERLRQKLYDWGFTSVHRMSDREVERVAMCLLPEHASSQPGRPEFLPVPSLITTGPPSASSSNPNGWPREELAALESFYGEVGTNLTTVNVPYPHRLSWESNTTVNRITCHQKVANSLVSVLSQVLKEYGLEKIKELRLDVFGGCYNKRPKRGGTGWSTHAWGIALDYDPEHNQLKWGRDRAAFARPEYEQWWKCWEAEGWVSLGRVANFDWMHVQAAIYK